MSMHTHNDDQMACPSCDQLYDMSGLGHRQQARCGSCNHLLAIYRKHAYAHVVAFSISGLIFFVMACRYPFMSFKSSGMESIMTLPQAITQIKGEGMWDLAIWWLVLF